LLLNATQALQRIFDRVDPFLKDDLLRGMVELLTGEPTPMRQRPVTAATVNSAMPEEERKKLLTLSPKIVPRRLPGARKIPDRLMGRVRRPHSRKLTRPMKKRQRNRIPTVRLDPLTRSFRDQRRSNHHAVMPERLHLAIEPVSRRPGFEADMQPVVSVSQSFDRPLDRHRIVLDIAHKPDFPGSATLRDRHGVLLLGDVESNKNFAILSHGPPSVHEARLGPPEQPSFLPARKGRATGSAREHDV
jgi:hypothetical protein